MNYKALNERAWYFYIACGYECDVGQNVAAQHSKEKRLLVSRLIRFDYTDALVPDQRENQSVSPAGESAWRIIGKVLWRAEKAGQIRDLIDALIPSIISFYSMDRRTPP